MTNRQSTISMLKKIIQQKKYPSCLQSYLPLQTLCNRQQNSKQEAVTKMSKYKSNPQKQISCYVKENNIKSQEYLKLQSNVIDQIDCLYIESRIQIKNITEDMPSRQVFQLPLQCLQSKLKAQKIKVHSSIDGVQASKHSQSKQQKSLPLSDLILSDNGYLKLSSQLNQHQTYKQSFQILQAQYFQNLKTLKHQTSEKLELVECQLQLIQRDQTIQDLQNRINDIQNDIFKIKLLSGKTNIQRDTLVQTKSRSKTPQLRRVRSFKNYFNQKQKINQRNQQNQLETKINTQREKIRRDKQKSVKMTEKLSKAKSTYKKLQLKLNQWEDELNYNHSNLINSPKIHSNLQKTKSHKIINTPKAQVLLTPKSPRMNGRIKHFEYLQKQKIKYYDTLKQHVSVIFQEIQTFRNYQFSRCQQLKQEIQLLRNQLKYLDVKNVQKFFFGSPPRNVLNKQSSRQKSKKSIFQNNYSQKLVSIHSTESLSIANLPLSPKSPKLQSKSPHLYSKSPQLYSKSPQLCSRSPKLTNPTQINGYLMRNKSIKLIKDITNMSGKSTNYSQTKNQNSKFSQKQRKIIQQQQVSEKAVYGKIKGRQSKQNRQFKQRDDKAINKQTQKNKALHNQINKQLKPTKKSSLNKVWLTNCSPQRHFEIMTQPSDQYCINSQNQFRF